MAFSATRRFLLDPLKSHHLNCFVCRSFGVINNINHHQSSFLTRINNEKLKERSILGFYSQFDYNKTPKRFAQSNFLNFFKKSIYSDLDLENAAIVLINKIYMQVPQKDLQTHAGIEDSFIMWFTMVQVHVWLVGQRLVKGDKEGKVVLEKLMKMMWEDVEGRLKQFEDHLKKNLSIKKRLKKYFQEMNLMFNLLDEGIGSSDADLASSLWTILKTKDQAVIQAWHLEVLVHYLRYWTAELDQMDLDDMIKRPDKIDFSFPSEITALMDN